MISQFWIIVDFKQDASLFSVAGSLSLGGGGSSK